MFLTKDYWSKILCCQKKGCCRRGCKRKAKLKINKNISDLSDDSENSFEIKEKKISKDFSPIKYEKKNNKRKPKVIRIEMKSLEKKNQLNDSLKNSKDNIINVKENIPIIIGLNNIGATCYMNSTLQCLSNTDKLTKYFLYKFKYKPGSKNKIMTNEYYKVIKNLWDPNNNNGSYSPNDFKKRLSEENPLFAGIAANDSKDLINFLLERFHSELNIKKGNNNLEAINYNQIDQTNEKIILNLFIEEFKNNYNSVISNLFYGLMETKSQCQGCNIIKFNFQVYSFIEFPLEKVNEYCFRTGKRTYYNMNNNKNPDVDIYECFEYYHNIDLMTGDNKMYCNICNCLCDALYGTLLYTAPNNLIIILNRGRGAVYECKVNFPDILNLSNYVKFKESNTLFELYAVICHIGPSSKSGHFVAYCKNRMDKKWYLYNDAFVTLCQNPQDYQKGMAYILFYQVVK